LAEIDLSDDLLREILLEDARAQEVNAVDTDAQGLML
jgi:hypothetical protein